jgi:hypothetical protein
MFISDETDLFIGGVTKKKGPRFHQYGDIK